MMKGIAQSSRDNSWHTRHTKKKAARRHSLLAYMTSGGRERSSTARSMMESEAKYQAAKRREAGKRVGITGWLSYGFSRMWGTIKSSFSKFTSFHGKTMQDVQTHS